MVRWGGTAERWSFDHGSNSEGCHDSFPLGWPMMSWLFYLFYLLFDFLSSWMLNTPLLCNPCDFPVTEEKRVINFSDKQQGTMACILIYLLQICFCLSLKQLGCRARVIALRKSTKLQHFEINCTTLKAEIASSPQLSPTQVMLSTKIQHGNHFRH